MPPCCNIGEFDEDPYEDPEEEPGEDLPLP